MSELNVGNWTVQVNSKDIYLMNMANLNNSICVHKNLGYGDKKFYVAYNNANVALATLLDLERFIDTKFVRKNTMPEEVFKMFTDNINKYQ